VSRPLGTTLAGDVIRVTIARQGLRPKTGDWAVTRSGLSTAGVWCSSRVLLNARNTQRRHLLGLGCIRCICAGGDVWRLGDVSMGGATPTSGEVRWRMANSEGTPGVASELDEYSLREVRAERLLSIRELAQLASVAPSTIFLIEAGRTTPHLAVVRRIAAALNVDPAKVVEFRRAIGAYGGFRQAGASATTSPARTNRAHTNIAIAESRRYCAGRSVSLRLRSLGGLPERCRWRRRGPR